MKRPSSNNAVDVRICRSDGAFMTAVARTVAANHYAFAPTMFDVTIGGLLATVRWRHSAH